MAISAVVRFEATNIWLATRRISALRHFVHPIQLLEELAPVAVASLVLGERIGEPLVIRQPAQQIGARPRLVHRKFRVGHVGRLQLFNLFVDARRASPRWYGQAKAPLQMQRGWGTSSPGKGLKPAASAAIC